MNKTTVAQQAKTASFLPPAQGLLQRKCACGNHTVAGGECKECAKKKSNLQRKLAIGASNDPLEREADRVADQVMAASTHSVASGALPRIQRYAGHATEGMDTAPASVDRVLASSGKPMEPTFRQDMEQRFGHDFSRVRVYTGGAAEQSARDVSAHAYTVGQNMVFGEGQFSPSSHEGRRLVAHELTHVVQQSGTDGWNVGQSNDKRGLSLIYSRIAATLQRQSVDDIPRPDGPGRLPERSDPASDEDVLITQDILGTVEPSCPRPPTGLGNLEQAPACQTDVEEVEGDRFRFCADSDVFLSGERSRLLSMVSNLDSRTTFEVHGYASKDAPGRTEATRNAYNVNLSCHRAKRAARELVNAGVGEGRIEIAAQGGSERFGPGEKNVENRAVLVHHDTPARQAVPSFNLPERPSAADVQPIVDAAAARLVRGEYQLAADAYVARWTCGHFRSLSEIVERATVRVDPSLSGDDTEQGIISPTGVNTVRISPEIRRTDDPVECAANRVADLAFHHAVRPQMHHFSDQHAAALHMLSLAGLRKCHVSQPPLFAHDFDVPSTTDPQAGQQPLCADAPLPGAIRPQQQRAGQPGAPTFTFVDMNVPSNAGSISIDDPNPRGLLVEANPDGGLAVAATVAVAGDPREIGKYEIGVVQTVVGEDFEVSYFGGQRIRSRVPLPLRDGPKQGDARSDPPWFDVDSHARAQPGNVSIGMTDMPNMFLFRTFVDLDKANFFNRQPVPTSSGQPSKNAIDRPAFDPFDNTTKKPTPPDLRNAPDRGHREMRFNTWVVARQVEPPAPLSRFSSIFVAGKRITFRIDANFLGDAFSPRGQGTWSVSTADATAADQESVRLRGATPADFAGRPPLFNEFLISEGAPPLAQAGGINSTTQLNSAVQQVVTPHRRALGIPQALLVDVRWDMSTGRVMLDDSRLSGGVVRVRSSSSGPQVTSDQAARLARAIFPEIRKIVIGQVGLNPNIPTATLTFAQPTL